MPTCYTINSLEDELANRVKSGMVSDMSRIVEICTIILFVTIMGLFVFVMTDPLGTKARNRQTRREQDVAEIAKILQTYAADHKGVLPTGIGSEWVQLGKAGAGCAINNYACGVKNDTCLDLNKLSGSDKVSLPVDIEFGTLDKTGYAVAVTAPHQLTVKACYTYHAAQIQQTIEVP